MLDQREHHYDGDEVKQTLCKLLLMFRLAVDFGVYARVLMFYLFYLILFYSVLQMSVFESNMIPRSSWDLHWDYFRFILALLKTKKEFGTLFNLTNFFGLFWWVEIETHFSLKCRKTNTPLSNDWQTSCLMDNSWLVQESQLWTQMDLVK